MRKISPETLQTLFGELNPHWTTGQIDPEIRAFKKRKYFELFYPLVGESTVHRAVILMGPRRVGKTVMLHQAIQQALYEGSDPTSIIYIPLDAPLFQGLSLDELTRLYKEIFERKNLAGCTVIFDEIQYLKDWSIHLKVLVDQNRRTQFVASGSAAAALRLKSTESGAGRFTDFTLPPLTFYEFLDLRKLVDVLILDSKGGNPTPKDIDLLNSEFINYINYGGYPEAVFNQGIQKNPGRFIRSDIIEKVLLQDLPSLYGISDIQELTRLFNTLAFHTGNEVTYEGLARASEIAKNTIKKYIEYLEAAFLLKTVNRIDNSGKTFKKINYFKVHLTNPSMYAALFGLVKDTDANLGNLIETAVYSQWMHAGVEIRQIHYARWKRGGNEGEVDMVYLDREYRPAWCTEVKWTDRYFHHPGELKSLIHFCNQCNIGNPLVTTKATSGEKTVGNLSINFIESAVQCYLLGRNIIESKDVGLDQLENNQEDNQLSIFSR